MTRGATPFINDAATAASYFSDPAHAAENNQLPDHMAMTEGRFDLLIRNGDIIDGTGAPRVRADLGVRGDRIAAIGDLSQTQGASEIDAAGRIVAPGFIDVHTHDDNCLLDRPDMFYKTSQGVTSVVVGNCGISLAPYTLTGDRPHPPLDLLGSNFEFPSMASFFDRLDAEPAAVNAAALCGHTTLRLGAMESVDRPATDDEIDVMRDRLAEALDAGAAGLSTGLAYEPAMPAPTEEVLRLFFNDTATTEIYTTHLRYEEAHILDAMDEAFRIGRESGAAVVLSHHKVAGEENFGRTRETLPVIDKVRQTQTVDLDVYPYHASSTVISLDRVRACKRVLITWSEPFPEHAGRELADIAADFGCTPEDAAARLQPGGAIYFSMDEADVRRVIEYPHSMIASDGLPNDHHPHPRLWGTFPRVLGHYSRDLGLIALEDAVHRMTGRPAAVFGLTGRGVLEIGNFADITIFDPDTVIDRADFGDPTAPAAGIDAVFVNGDAAMRNGAATGSRSGKALRRNAS
jgi:N-acyl-D-amino-acid deacylase